MISMIESGEVEPIAKVLDFIDDYSYVLVKKL